MQYLYYIWYDTIWYDFGEFINKKYKKHFTGEFTIQVTTRNSTFRTAKTQKKIMHVKVLRFDLCQLSRVPLVIAYPTPVFFCRFSMTNRSRSTNLSLTDPTQTNRSSRPLLQLHNCKEKSLYNFRSSNSSVLVPKLLYSKLFIYNQSTYRQQCHFALADEPGTARCHYLTPIDKLIHKFIHLLIIYYSLAKILLATS